MRLVSIWFDLEESTLVLEMLLVARAWNELMRERNEVALAIKLAESLMDSKGRGRQEQNS